MAAVDNLLLTLIETGRQALAEEVAAIIAHVAQAPFASYLSHVPHTIRIGLEQAGIQLPPGKVRAV